MEPSHKRLKNFAFILIGVGGLCILFFVVSLYLNNIEIANGATGINFAITGQIGDFIGGIVGSIWPLAGVILFYLAILIQNKELNQQINEFREARKIFTKERFDNQFYNSLNSLDSIINNLSYNTDISTTNTKVIDHKARTVFVVLYDVLKKLNRFLFSKADADIKRQLLKELKEHFYDMDKWGLNVKPEDLLQDSYFDIKTIYPLWYNRFHYLLGHYFRSVYHILKFIDAETEINDKTPYIDWLKARLSNAELLLLLYNGMFFPKSGALLRKYKIIDNLPKEYVFREEHLKHYKIKLKNLDKIEYKEIALPTEY